MADIYVNQTVTGSNNIVAGTGDIHVHYEVSAGEAKERRELLVLLGKVRQMWIKGLLENSLENELRIELRTEEEPAALAEDDGAPMPPPLTEKHRLIDVFHEAAHALLILGAPGSGKTFAMLELARDLLNVAEQDPRQPIPVILNLSSWGEPKQTFKEWLIGELHSKYRIQKEKGRSWLEQNYLMLFLDGLDEVRPEHRGSCVEAINGYSLDAGLSGLVVSSRMDEYMLLPVRLMLNRAVCLSPLTPEQIEAYLTSAGDRLESLRAVLQADDALQSLAQTPLMLHVMSLAYQGLPVASIAGSGNGTTGSTETEARRHQLFELYIQRMFELKAPEPRQRTVKQKVQYSQEETIQFEVDGGSKPASTDGKRGDARFTREQTTRWLSWLAREMQRHSKVIFLLEELQPSWLGSRGQRWIYALASRVIAGLLMGIAMGLTIGLLIGWGADGVTAFYDALAGLAFGAIFGLSGGLVAGVLFALRYETTARAEPVVSEEPVSARSVVLDVVLYVAALGLVGTALIYIIGGPNYALSVGLTAGSFLGLVFGLMFGLRGRKRDMGHDIQTVESLHWSWNRARNGALKGALGGMVVAAVFGLISGLFFQDDLIFAVIAAVLVLLIGGIAGGVFGMVFGGLASTPIERKIIPNQGIRLSARNAVYGGLRVGIVFAVLITGIFLVMEDASSALMIGFAEGLFFALMAALYYGGLNVTQHYTLRLLLVKFGYAPKNFVPFLDHATRLIFMRRIGGGYIFIHRFLLEYFAEQAEAEQAVARPEG